MQKLLDPNNDMIQQLAADGATQTFQEGILPGRAWDFSTFATPKLTRERRTSLP
jgi:hypothetical protein